MIANNEKTKRKPANGFKAGQSGNPSGRPKKTEEELDLIAACKAKTPEALETIQRIMTEGQNEKNQLQAALAIIERAWGKPVQPTDNQHSGSMTFTWQQS